MLNLCAFNITLFRANSEYQFYGRIYSFLISENGKEIMDLVPYKRSDDKAVFYDKVSQTYITPVGEGFFCGDEVEAADPAAIEKTQLNSEVNDGIRYSLDGRRVSDNYRGIVILNGKKMLVK